MQFAVHLFTESYRVPTLYRRCTACHRRQRRRRRTGPPTAVLTLLLLLYRMTAQTLLLLLLSCSHLSELCRSCCNCLVTVAWHKSLTGCFPMLPWPASRQNEFFVWLIYCCHLFNPSQHQFVRQGRWEHSNIYVFIRFIACNSVCLLKCFVIDYYCLSVYLNPCFHADPLFCLSSSFLLSSDH